MTRRRIVSAFVVLCAAGPVKAQEPVDPPTFRAGTTLVNVSAIVTRDGVPVTDLAPDEVQVLDEGRPQPLVAFEFVDLTTAQGSAERRDFVLVLDDRQIAPNRTMSTRDIALTFINSLGAEDRLAIVNTGSKELVQQLSTDRRTSESLVRRVQGERRARLPTEVVASARIAFEVLRNVARVLQREGADERRAVLFVSEGHVLPEGPAGNEFPELRRAYREVLQEAATSNVAIYTVDVRGLVAGAPTGPPRPVQMTDTRKLPRVHGTEPATLPAESRLAEGLAAAMADRRLGSLGQLARHTGGGLTVDTNELGRDIPRILQESRQYYRLTYAQPDVAADEGETPIRQIDVKVLRPGVQVRARQQYVPVPSGDAVASAARPVEMEAGAAAPTSGPP